MLGVKYIGLYLAPGANDFIHKRMSHSYFAKRTFPLHRRTSVN